MAGISRLGVLSNGLVEQSRVELGSDVAEAVMLEYSDAKEEWYSPSGVLVRFVTFPTFCSFYFVIIRMSCKF